jgi:hypothetical protein
MIHNGVHFHSPEGRESRRNAGVRFLVRVRSAHPDLPRPSAIFVYPTGAISPIDAEIGQS